jgi:hypothetical protein
VKIERKIGLSFIAAMFAGAACCQTTLGELADKGAVKVTRDIWQSLLPVSFGGLDFTGRVNFQFEFKGNGKFSGSATSTSGNGTSGSFGTWTMDETGKQCIDEKLTTWNIKWQECYFLYKLQDQYFAVESDADRNTRALTRTVTSAK